jgi:hypothetical protein
MTDIFLASTAFVKAAIGKEAPFNRGIVQQRLIVVALSTYTGGRKSQIS